MSTGNRNPFEPPASESGTVSRNESGDSRYNLISLAVVAFLIVTAVVAFTWPDDWPIHTPLASFFGPWLAFRLGAVPVALFGLLVFAAFVTPSCCKRNTLTYTLLPLGFLSWAVVGGFIGQILWA